MLKATLTDGTIVFGLSDENLKRLKAGMPILLNLADLGLESRRVLIFSGKTEADMTAELDRIISGAPPTRLS